MEIDKKIDEKFKCPYTSFSFHKACEDCEFNNICPKEKQQEREFEFFIFCCEDDCNY